MSISPKAVVLLSGGLDSTTTLAIAKDAGYELHALSFDYGQRNRWEIECASRVAAHYGAAEHRRITIDLRAFGGSSLTSNQEVERNRPLEVIGSNIPSTYVPARNTLFLSYALAFAEVLEANDIFIGVNAVDTSGYPDCRPEFIAAFQKMANLGTKIVGLKIHAPLQTLNKASIIRKGLSLGVDYGMTSTCYDPLAEGKPCGSCDACILRRRAFHELGSNDPLQYP